MWWIVLPAQMCKWQNVGKERGESYRRKWGRRISMMVGCMRECRKAHEWNQNIWFPIFNVYTPTATRKICCTCNQYYVFTINHIQTKQHFPLLGLRPLRWSPIQLTFDAFFITQTHYRNNSFQSKYPVSSCSLLILGWSFLIEAIRSCKRVSHSFAHVHVRTFGIRSNPPDADGSLEFS